MNNPNRISRTNIVTMLATLFFVACTFQEKQPESPKSFSGVYPHLAYYNNEGECGTGAVVPWGDQLWVITYGPHLPNGSSDKLYEITSLIRGKKLEKALKLFQNIKKDHLITLKVINKKRAGPAKARAFFLLPGYFISRAFILRMEK